MTKVLTTVMKIDHDAWWGYYIDDDLYGYDDSYNFTNNEVINEALLRMFERGVIKHRDECAVIFQHAYDQKWWSEEGDEELQNMSKLPDTLTQLIAHFQQFAE